MFEITGKYTNAKVMIDNVEESCVGQITQMVNHVAFTNPVAIMPDTHAGKGSVIGFTMELGDKLIPNIIGVDIGCGMLSLNMGRNLFNQIKRSELDARIRENVPFGSEVRQKVSKHFNMKRFVANVNKGISEMEREFNKRQLYLDLKSKCISVGIVDQEIIKMVYENTFDNEQHELSEDVIRCLERI